MYKEHERRTSCWLGGWGHERELVALAILDKCGAAMSPLWVDGARCHSIQRMCCSDEPSMGGGCRSIQRICCSDKPSMGGGCRSIQAEAMENKQQDKQQLPKSSLLSFTVAPLVLLRAKAHTPIPHLRLHHRRPVFPFLPPLFFFRPIPSPPPAAPTDGPPPASSPLPFAMPRHRPLRHFPDRHNRSRGRQRSSQHRQQ